jgi:SAM-dependent methyltransferase
MDEAITQWFAPAVGRKDARILDFGCGEGQGVEALIGAGFTNVTGIDQDKNKVAAGRSRNLNLMHGDVYDLLGLEFDLVFTSHALNNTGSIRDTLYILRSLTKEFIFFIVPIGTRQNSSTKPALLGSEPSTSSAEFVDIVNGLRLPNTLQEVQRENAELWGILGCAQSRSALRQACDQFVRDASVVTCAELKSGKLLYVGTAGDPAGGEYTAYFPGFDRKTADADPQWRPDIICDITNTGFADASWDAVVCSNVMEHVPDLLALPRELARIIRPGGHLLIDCPWSYPYHAEPPSFGDYWRISLDGFGQLFASAFIPVMMEQKETSTHALYRRKTA